MILDSTLLFSDQQAITADAASTNVLDMQSAPIVTTFAGVSAKRDIGPGTTIKVVGSVIVTFATTVSIIFSLQTSSDNFASDTTFLWSTPAIVVATLVQGYRFQFPDVPAGAKRYLRMFYDVSTSATAGKVTTGLALADDQGNILT